MDKPTNDGSLVLVLVLVTTLLWMAGLFWVIQSRPLPAVEPPSPKPAVRTLTARAGWDPIATYDPADKRLDVTNHLAADALVCITDGQGDPVCKLTREWVGR